MKLLPRSAEWLGLEEQFLGNKEAWSANTVQPINRHLSSLFWPARAWPNARSSWPSTSSVRCSRAFSAIAFGWDQQQPAARELIEHDDAHGSLPPTLAVWYT